MNGRSTSFSSLAARWTACSPSSSKLDIEALALSTGRSFSDAERREIRHEQQRAYRWTFLVSGLEHPKFAQIVREPHRGRPRQDRGRRSGAVGVANLRGRKKAAQWLAAGVVVALRSPGPTLLEA